MRHVALLFVAAAAAAAPPPAFDPDAVTAAVARLSHPDYRTREAAGASIVRAGDRALPLVRTALAGCTDPESARRLEVLAERLDGERLRTPRRVTLRAKAAPLKDVLADITAQTGYVVKIADADGGSAPRPSTPVTADIVDLPFLQALDVLCDQNDLAHVCQDDAGVITVSAEPTLDPHKAYTGPFRVTATQIYTSGNVQLAGRPRHAPLVRTPEQVTLTLAVEAEPKAALLGLGPVKVLAATDDLGHNLVPAASDEDGNDHPLADLNTTDGFGARGPTQAFAQSCQVSLARADRKATVIKTLKLQFSATLVAETVVTGGIDDMFGAKAKGKTLADRRASLELVQATTADGMVTIEVTARRTPAGPNDDSNGWAYEMVSRVQVVDAKGVPYAVQNRTITDSNPTTVSFKQTFARPQHRRVGKPVRLQLVDRLPRSQDVTVTLTDIPLP